MTWHRLRAKVASDFRGWRVENSLGLCYGHSHEERAPVTIQCGGGNTQRLCDRSGFR
jgi:hypothetical protein